MIPKTAFICVHTRIYFKVNSSISAIYSDSHSLIPTHQMDDGEFPSCPPPSSFFAPRWSSPRYCEERCCEFLLKTVRHSLWNCHPFDVRTLGKRGNPSLEREKNQLNFSSERYNVTPCVCEQDQLALIATLFLYFYPLSAVCVLFGNPTLSLL